MPVNSQPKSELNVAIIGGGPGGLGAAIALGKLLFVNFTLYEKKSRISETGGGISLQQHTWRMLELMGAAKNIKPEDYGRSSDGLTGEHRNGRNGEVLSKRYAPAETPLNQRSCRMVRPKLQNALLREVDPSQIQVGKKLVDIHQLASGKMAIAFEDGHKDEVDLLVGADGIRSTVRSFSFSHHDIKYIGQSAYRTLISTSKVHKKIPDMPHCPVFWHHIGGKYVFTCPLGGDVFEVTARIRRSPEGQEHVSWGQPFDLHVLLDEYDDFCLPVRQVLQLAAEGETQEFAMFSGARLESCISHGAVALVGDAAHPLSGAFGAGAGFALEDAWTLARTTEWAWKIGQSVVDALDLFDRIRSPHYRELYGVLDRTAGINLKLAKENLPADKEIYERVRRTWEGMSDWMCYHQADEAVMTAIRHQQEEF